MPKPTFTIIISTHNRRDLLPRAIHSVLGQTFPDFELLVIDNGSTDDTRFIVQKIIDPRIQYFLNPNPTSSCDGPRNLGIQMANGFFISFLDDDDIWYPERLEKVKNAFDENPGVGAVCHNENRRINGRLTEILKYGTRGNIYETLLYERNCMSSCATTIRTSLLHELNGFDLREAYDAAADYELWLRMASKDVKVHFIEESLGEFSVTGNNWSTVDPAFESKVAILVKDHILKYEKKEISQISIKGLWRLFQLYYIAARAFLKAGDYKNGFKYCFQAFMFLIFRPVMLVKLFTRIFQIKLLQKWA